MVPIRMSVWQAAEQWRICSETSVKKNNRAGSSDGADWQLVSVFRCRLTPAAVKLCIHLPADSQQGMFRGSRACAVRCLNNRRSSEELVSVTALTAGGELQHSVITPKTKLLWCHFYSSVEGHRTLRDEPRNIKKLKVNNLFFKETVDCFRAEGRFSFNNVNKPNTICGNVRADWVCLTVNWEHSNKALWQTQGSQTKALWSEHSLLLLYPISTALPLLLLYSISIMNLSSRNCVLGLELLGGSLSKPYVPLFGPHLLKWAT